MGVVKSRGGVGHAAKALDNLIKLACLEILSRFEVEVFQHMGDSTLAHRLVATSHFVEDVCRDDSRAVMKGNGDNF